MQCMILSWLNMILLKLCICWQLILDFLEEIIQSPGVLIGNSVGSLACLIGASGIFPYFLNVPGKKDYHVLLILFMLILFIIYFLMIDLFISHLCLQTDANQSLIRGIVLLNCAGGMNNKAVVDDWRIKLFLPLLWLIDFLLNQRGIATFIFERVRQK